MKNDTTQTKDKNIAALVQVDTAEVLKQSLIIKTRIRVLESNSKINVDIEFLMTGNIL